MLYAKNECCREGEGSYLNHAEWQHQRGHDGVNSVDRLNREVPTDKDIGAEALLSRKDGLEKATKGVGCPD